MIIRLINLGVAIVALTAVVVVCAVAIVVGLVLPPHSPRCGLDALSAFNREAMALLTQP